MDRTLQELVIKGIKTTITFHRWLVNHPRFIQGDFDTTFVEREYLKRRHEPRGSNWEIASIAAAIRAYQSDHEETKGRYEIKVGDAHYEVKVVSLGDRRYHVSLLNHDHRADLFEVSENLYSIISDGRSYEVDMIERGNIYQVFVKGMSYPVEILRPKEEMPLPIKEEEEVPPSREEVVSTPMTCQVIKILVKTGEIVESDEELFVVEAMKLEMPIPSPIRGRVKEVLVKEGQTIDTGTKLLTLTPL